MLSTSSVSIVLLLVWGILYYLLHKKLYTAKLYFMLLLLMGGAGLFFYPLPLMDLVPDVFNLSNILLFALLMVLAVLPWLIVDKLIKRRPLLYVDDISIKTIKTVNMILIILPAYSIIYSMPYALLAASMGADNVRTVVSDGSLMPPTIYTTFAVGFASFSPIIVLMFYISLLDNRLKKYSFWLTISSMSILVTNMASAARDAFIFIPFTYLCFYFLFRFSLGEKTKKNLKMFGVIALVFIAIVLGGITIARFYNDSHDSSRLVYGTWGYFYQQPYVFDHIIEQTQYFYGFNRRLKFLRGFFDIGGSEYSVSTANKVDYMFGTQYAEFYQMAGYTTLFVGFVFFLLLFYNILSYHYRRKNYFALLVAFCIYFIFTFSGLFYFRYGGNNSEFFFYMGILIITFLLPNILKIKLLKINNYE